MSVPVLSRSAGACAAAAFVAAGAAAAAPACVLSAAPETVEAARAVDGDTVALSDGREVRLAGIEAPKPPLGTSAAAWPLAEDARAALADEALGRPLSFRAVGAPDRYGRLVGQLAGVADADHASLATGLLERGFVRAAADRAGRDCRATLFAAEAPARRERLGLWSHSYYEVRDAADGRALAALAGRFAVVEGRVASIRHRAGRTYVNFGRVWREALSVTLTDAAAKRLGGIAVLGLAPGARLRVRGLIEQRLGPTISVVEAAQIERLGAGE